MPKRVVIPEEFVNQLDSFRKDDPKEWEEHYRLATKRLLSSMFFLVSAKSVYKQGNKLLSAIGYYYSLFHLSKALLFLLPHYNVKQLRGISHKEVLDKIRTEFVQRNILSKDYIETFRYTKKIREAANYGQDTWISLSRLLRENEAKIMRCIKDGSNVLKKICDKEITHIRSIIGDGIGDDWRDSYLSEEESELLTSILLEHDLTT